jgi:hypothetical protein
MAGNDITLACQHQFLHRIEPSNMNHVVIEPITSWQIKDEAVFILVYIFDIQFVFSHCVCCVRSGGIAIAPTTLPIPFSLSIYFFNAIKNNFAAFHFPSHQIASLASFCLLQKSIQFGKIYFSSPAIFV